MQKKIMIALSILCTLALAQGIKASTEDNVKTTSPVTDIIASEDTHIGNVKVEEIKPPADIRSVPTRMNFQGYLTNSSGQPINGNVPMTISIWDAYNGGNRVWGDEVDTAYCNSGLFNILIGNKVPINPYVFTAGNYRVLKLRINNQDSVKVIITNTGYAYSSSKSDSSAWAYNSDRLDNHHWSEVPTSAQYIDEGQAAGSDLSGTYPNPTVDGLQNRSVSATTPGSGQVLQWNGSQWAPATISGDGNNYPSGISFSGTTTKTLTMTRNGLGNLTASFTDLTGGSGTVTSISQGTGIICTPNPLTNTGTISFNTGYTVPDADRVDGYHASASQSANTLRPLDSSGRFFMGGSLAGTWWIAGQNSATDGIGVMGSASGSAGYGLYGVATSTSGTARAVYGYGRIGGYFVGTPSSGALGRGVTCGLEGHCSGSGDRAGGYFDNGGTGSAFVGCNFSGTGYKIYGSGNVSCVMPTQEGNKVLFAPECPEPYFEDFGQEQLMNGHCHIELDPLFLDCIKNNTEHPMKVFIQPNDDCMGTYVRIHKTGFDVYELQNGTSNAEFTFRVVAYRKDTDYLRFPPAVDPRSIKTEEIDTEDMKIGGE